MKKLISVILALMCIFSLFGCSADKDISKTEKTEVYTFSGENEYISVINGAVIIDPEEETFVGGELRILQDEIAEDTVCWSEEFYVFRDGEKKIIQKNIMNDESGGAKVSVSGDLGKISGANVINEYNGTDEDSFVDNLFFVFTVRNSEGIKKTYEIQMKVKKVY